MKRRKKTENRKCIHREEKLKGFEDTNKSLATYVKLFTCLILAKNLSFYAMDVLRSSLTTNGRSMNREKAKIIFFQMKKK
jgi:hypothetical protein